MATSQHGTLRSDEDELANKTPRIDEFRRLLLKISQEIPKEKLPSLKWLCGAQLQRQTLDNIDSPIGLFSELMDRGLIGEDNKAMLVDLLNAVELYGLVQKYMLANNQASDLDGKKAKLIKFLKDLYKRHYANVQPIPWNDGLKLELKDVYTRLEVREVKRGSAKVGKDLNDLHDIFQPNSEGDRARRVRIEGAPAMGKSTLCRKIAYDWSCDGLSQFSLLFFLEMRHVSKGEVVDEIFNQLLSKDTEFTKQEISELISQSGESVLFLFDGLDETSDAILEDSDIPDHINEKYYSWCITLITTRPRLCDEHLSQCDLHLIVKGFTSESTKIYILKYFQIDKEKGKKLIDEISKRRSDMSQIFVKDLLRNPLHISFLCILWEDQKREEKLDFPETLSGLYLEILDCILKRYCVKKKIPLSKQGSVPPEVLNDITKLGLDSLRAYKSNKSDFRRDDLSSETSLELGFLVKDLGHSRVRIQEIYYFSHRTWLEFFSALHIAFLLRTGLTEDRAFQNEGTKHLTLLKFVAGVTGVEEGKLFFREFNERLTSSTMRGICCECICESKSPKTSITCVDACNVLTVIYCGNSGKKVDAKFISCLQSEAHFIVEKKSCTFDCFLHIMKLKQGVFENLVLVGPNQTEISKLTETLRTLSLTLHSVMVFLSTDESVVKVIDKLSDMIKDDSVQAPITSLTIGFTVLCNISFTETSACLDKLFKRIEENTMITEVSICIMQDFYTGHFFDAFKKIILTLLKFCSKNIQIGGFYSALHSMGKDLNSTLRSLNTHVKSLCIYEDNDALVDSETLTILSENTTLSDISIGVLSPESIHGVCDLIRRNTHALSLSIYAANVDHCVSVLEALKENKSLNNFKIAINAATFLEKVLEKLMSALLIPISKHMDSGQSGLTSIKVSARNIYNKRYDKISNMILWQQTKGEWSYETELLLDSIQFIYSTKSPITVRYHQWHTITYSYDQQGS
ncbi:uncharacterized protein [Ptychodera flava]|uniref:uncharacterized protein n=1 Tax=Ptychodera flava TaxID=63121 RepID=UPI00396AAA11